MWDLTCDSGQLCWRLPIGIAAYPRRAFILEGDLTPTNTDLLLLATYRGGSLITFQDKRRPPHISVWRANISRYHLTYMEVHTCILHTSHTSCNGDETWKLTLLQEITPYLFLALFCFPVPKLPSIYTFRGYLSADEYPSLSGLYMYSSLS